VNTTLFAVAVVALSVVAGLALAVLLAGKLRFTAAYQAIYFLPVITPMVPMAIGLGGGAQLQRPLALTIIGGLTLTTALTLVYTPVLYMMMHKIKRPAT
jgi:HAE1 family hydrophobic/amphiphilic exporter-1